MTSSIPPSATPDASSVPTTNTTAATSSQDSVDTIKPQAHSPPPAYASLSPAGDLASSTSSSQSQHLPPPFPTNNIYTPLPNPPSSHSQTFGPTPMGLNQPLGRLLPYAYYEAPGAADARARRRFIRAVLCGVGLYVLFMSLVTLEVVGEGGVQWYKA